MKKGFLIAAIVLFIGSAVGVYLAVQSFTDYNSMLTVSNEQAAKSDAAEKVGNDDQAIRFLEYSTENLAFANDNKFQGYMAVGGSIILLIGGIVVLRKGKNQV